MSSEPAQREWPSDLAKTVVRALSGLVETNGDDPIRAPYHFTVVSRILADTADTGLVENTETAAALKLGKIRWDRLVGRIGGVALRAISPALRDDERNALLSFLEVWSRTPMADRTARLRRGATTTSTTVMRTQAGAVVALGMAYSHKPRPFVDRAFSPDDPPTLGEVDHVTDAPLVWGDTGQITRLIAAVRQHGPVPWDRQAVDFLAESIRTPRATAALLLAGALIGHTKDNDTLPTAQQRKRLALTVTEVEAAQAKQFRRLDYDTRLDILASALPEDPETLWEPGGLHRVAERIAPVWQQKFGRGTAVPVATLTAIDALRWTGPHDVPAGELCSWLAEPTAHPLLTDDLSTWVQEHSTRHGHGYKCHPQDEWRRFTEILEVVTTGLRWAYADLPAGDPVRDGVPHARELLLRRLDNPGLLLSSPAKDVSADTITGRFGTTPYLRQGEADTELVDDGLTIVALDQHRRKGLYFRPAELDKDERTERLESTVPDHPDTDLARVRRLRSDAAQALAHRIRTGALPSGAYEANPVASAPDLVREVVAELRLDVDAAALYLQLLALPEPTDHKVRTWNHWSPARHKKAGAALVSRELVVRGSRTSAGRTLFLPGEWIDYDWLGSVDPRERFKDDLRAAAETGDRPGSFDWWLLPDRFAYAWNNRPTP